MGDVLSQSEIDELLKALSTGELDPTEIKTTPAERKIKLYDFRRPNKFAKEHLRSLQIIFENFSMKLSSYFAGTLRTPTQIEVSSVEEITYHEFNNSLSNPVVLSIVDFQPLKGSILLEISPNLSSAIIDRILGGPGVSIEKIRSFTEIELIILERIIIQMINLMIDPWENVIKLNPVFEKIETNSQFAQIISPNEMVALVTINVKIGEIEGIINVCIPHLVIEPVVSKLNTKYWFSSKIEEEKQTHYHEIIEKNLNNAHIPLKAILGETQANLLDLLHLQVGDVIKLDSYTNSELEVMVGNFSKFKARPGINKGKMAIQIVEVIGKGDQ